MAGDRPNSAAGTPPRQIKMIVLCDEHHVGDKNQSAGIADATAEKLRAAGVTVKTRRIDLAARVSADDALHAKLTTRWPEKLRSGRYDRYVLIASGSNDKIDTLLGEIPQKPGFVSVLSTHQMSSALTTASGLPSVVAIPAGTVDERQSAELAAKAGKLVLTHGVAHALTAGKMRSVAEQYAANRYPPIPPINQNTVTVVLAGDAPDEQGRQKLFDEKDARDLAHRIARFEAPAAERDIIVTNGPRTGKFDGNMERTPNPHRTGEPDPVTVAFVQEIAAITGKAPTLFDFQFAQLPSAYTPLLHAYRQAGPDCGNFHVPAESVSMVTEAASMLDRVVVDAVPSMNASHEDHLQQAYAAGGIDILRQDGSVRRRAPAQTRRQLASEQIADAVMAQLEES